MELEGVVGSRQGPGRDKIRFLGVFTEIKDLMPPRVGRGFFVKIQT